MYDGCPLSYHLDNSITDIRTAIPFILESENIKVMGHTVVYMMQTEHLKHVIRKFLSLSLTITVQDLQVVPVPRQGLMNFFLFVWLKHPSVTSNQCTLYRYHKLYTFSFLQLPILSLIPLYLKFSDDDDEQQQTETNNNNNNKSWEDNSGYTNAFYFF